MTDGSFSDVAGQNFGAVFGGGWTTDCVAMASTGSVLRCAAANVVCEKKLVRDVIMCVDKTTLATSVNLNASTSISISSFDQTNYFKASLCIEYCRGTDSNQVRMTACFAFLQHLKRVHYFNGNVILFLVCGYRWIDLLLRRQTPHGPKRTRYNR